MRVFDRATLVYAYEGAARGWPRASESPDLLSVAEARESDRHSEARSRATASELR